MKNNDNASEDLEKEHPQEPYLDLPTWLKDKQGNNSIDNLIVNDKADNAEDLNSTGNHPTGSGWQKEVESIVKESTKPITLDGSQAAKPKSNNELDSTEKYIPDDNSLPEWLDLVVETEEDKITTQLNLNTIRSGEDFSKDSGSISFNAITGLESSSHDEFNSTPLTQTSEQALDTQPLFMNIAEGTTSPKDEQLKDFRLDLIENLLLRAETDKVSALGQELIKDTKFVEELSELLLFWLTDNPDSVEMWHLLGDAYMHLNRPTKAVKAYSKATQLLSS
ncbi:MAG: hypothetical protein MUO40_03390 [Anaerolineaceae bacterium]|nr:hypothetical protein [Anaerolineaceae bacterium]